MERPFVPGLDARPAWERLAGLPAPPGHASAAAVASLGDGCVVAGSTSARGAGYHMWVLRLDGELRPARGAPEWRGVRGHARAVAVLSDSGWVVAGEEEAAPDRFRGSLVSFAPDAAERWRLAPGPAGVNGLTAVVAVADGAVVAGGVRDGAGWLLRVDGEGAAEWDRELPELASVTGLAALGDGGVVAVGNGGDGVPRAVRVGAGGAPAWSRPLRPRGTGELAAVAAAPDGAALAAGRLRSESTPDGALWVVRVDADGGVEWERTYPGRAIEAGYGVAVLPSGLVAVAGDSAEDFFDRAARVWLLSAAGEQAGGWMSDVARERHARAVAAAPDGGVLVAGSTTLPEPGTTAAWVVRLSGEGSVLREATFGGA